MAGCAVSYLSVRLAEVRQAPAPVLARTPAQRAQMIERLIPDVAAGIRHEDDRSLRHELDRLEAQPCTPLSLRMRAIVRAEMTRRVAKAVG